MKLKTKRLLSKLAISMGLAMPALLTSPAAQAFVPAICTGQFFNPFSDADWNNFFPITIAGMQITSGSNTTAPLMQMMPPVCVCPTIFGIPFIGIGLTWWQPEYIAEIERRPGCLSSLGGIKVLHGYDMLHSEQSMSDGADTGKDANRMQIHWYQYPAATMLEMLTALTCKNVNGFNLAYITEVDPLWQDDTWSAIFAPESALFANPIAAASCAVDAIAAEFGYPLDPMFWCAGNWGTVYPLSGNSAFGGTPFQVNNIIQAKFIARSHRIGLMNQTIGPTAVCFAHPNPIWVKSQYRFNQVAPIPRYGRAVTAGSSGTLFQFPPVTNLPTQEHTVNLIWQGQQCCAKPIP